MKTLQPLRMVLVLQAVATVLQAYNYAVDELNEGCPGQVPGRAWSQRSTRGKRLSR